MIKETLLFKVINSSNINSVPLKLLFHKDNEQRTFSLGILN